MANAVLVVDMLRGFLEEGYPLYCGARARRVIPNIQGLLEQELAQGSKIFFILPSIGQIVSPKLSISNFKPFNSGSYIFTRLPR